MILPYCEIHQHYKSCEHNDEIKALVKAMQQIEEMERKIHLLKECVQDLIRKKKKNP